MAKKSLNIALVGYGFMGKTHSHAFLQAPRFFDVPYQPVLKAVVARNADRVRKFADTWGYQSAETDWRAVVDRKDIDLIDIASPNDTHAEIAIAAARAGKMVTCEKPLARNAADGEKMVAAVESARVPNSVWYNYRRVPAVTLLKQLINEGKLGRIFHYRAQFLQDWTMSSDLPQGGEGLWRLDVAVAGSGVTGDLLAHCIDTALWLNGSITDVTAMTETFIKERKHTLTGRIEPVGIDDASAFLARFQNGSLALFEATRYARGHKALYTLEINGEHASARWDLHDLHRLQWFDHRDESQLRGWRSVHISDGDHPYMKHWWVPGLQIGYEMIGERGNLLENPYHYRDVRNEVMMDAVFERVSRDRIYAITGIQFLQINTLFQLYAACRLTPAVVAAAHTLLTIPDLLNFWLSGRICSEYTVATTTQFVDAGKRTWAAPLLSELGLPARVLTEIVQPGTVIGTIRTDAAPALAGTPLVAPACHDTGSAVASVCAGGTAAFISSGTWSLMGTETDAPVITAKARDLNFTNEGGVCGTIRLLKNISGLWLLQACRRSWVVDGHPLDPLDPL